MHVLISARPRKQAKRGEAAREEGEEQKRQRLESAGEEKQGENVPAGEGEGEVKEQPKEGPLEEDDGEQSDEELGVEEAKEELEEFVPAELLDYVVSETVGVRCLRALTKRDPEQLQEQLTKAGASCTEDDVQEIVTKAREQSLDEIWYQICHQNDTLVEVCSCSSCDMHVQRFVYKSFVACNAWLSPVGAGDVAHLHSARPSFVAHVHPRAD